MKKFLFRFAAVLVGLYLALHIALGTAPVQRRVLAEIREALLEFGIDLRIESIEFSTLFPKIYLNRVTVQSTPKSEIQIPEPLTIDKIKIEFQPIALIYKRIVVEEVALFHPIIILPRADVLYRRIMTVIKEKKRVEWKGGTFTVVLKRFGVVDAVFNVVSKDPPFAIRSRSLSAFLENSATGQQTVTVESRDLEIQRGPLSLTLTKIDVDLDLSKKSLRVNRAVVEGDRGLAINVKGASSLPSKEEKNISFNASYEVNVPLQLLGKIPEIKLPQFDGTLFSAGTVKTKDGAYSGEGNVQYSDLVVDGYKIGRGSVQYSLVEKKVSLSHVELSYGGGEVVSKNVEFELKPRLPITGNVSLKNIKLEGILDSVKSPDVPVKMTINGTMGIAGFLSNGFEIKGLLKSRLSRLHVMNDAMKGLTPDNVILSVAEGSLDGFFTFTADRMSFDSVVNILDGKAQVQGFVGFDDRAKVDVKAERVSLTLLRQIAELKVGGVANIVASVDVTAGEPNIQGSFDIRGAELSDIVFGPVKGQAHFQSALLTFENLEVPSGLETVKGNGFVDFNPKTTHYKFHVDARRAGIDSVFKIFEKQKLGFAKPTGGEVSLRVSIEGGHDTKGIEITASGQGKQFAWYEEQWQSSKFFLTYRPDWLELSRVLLMKKSGGLEFRAQFGKDHSRLSFVSQGLRLEELNYLGKAPLVAEIVGEVTLEGKLRRPTGQGEFKLIKTAFRGNPIPDSAFTVRAAEGGMEIGANIFGEKLKGTLKRAGEAEKDKYTLQVSFDQFDFAPMVTVLLGKDIPTFGDITAKGELSLNGFLDDWKSMRGEGKIHQLVLGLKGTPMVAQQSVAIKVADGSLEIERLNLVGAEAQVFFDLKFEPETLVKASLDGKVDLKFIQPFVPALEFGTGKVTAVLRLSGRPRNFNLLGNITLEDGIFRLAGLSDEFRGAQVQLSVSQDRVDVNHFEATVNGGTLTVSGDVRINRFRTLIPNLTLSANRVALKTEDYLTTRFSGDFFIRGTEEPYLLSGNCRIVEGRLTTFEVAAGEKPVGSPFFKFDIKCDARERLFVMTDVMSAEFKGSFHLVGTSNQVGLMGSAEALQGDLLFREKKFALEAGTVRFESPARVAPRFNVAGRAFVKEIKTQPPREYEVNLQVFGTPEDYKIRLTSSPPESESDIISLLLLGVTSRTQEGNYTELGTAIVGQIPLQSRLQSKLGVDIKLDTQTARQPVTSTSSATADITVPSVRIEKDITRKTKLSYSNSLEATVPYRELKIEHLLSDSFTVNGTAADKLRGITDQTVQSYGLDFRYRFQFE